MSRVLLAIVTCGACAAILSTLRGGPESDETAIASPPPLQVATRPADPSAAIVGANANFVGLELAQSAQTEPGEKPKDPKKEDGKKPDDKKPDPKPKPLPGPFQFPKEVTPSEKQLAQRDALFQKYEPRREALGQEEKAVYTQEQHAAMKAAREAAHAAGKRGKEANDEVAKAIRLSEEQLTKLDQIHAKRKAMDDEIRTAIYELLTPEQRALVKKGPFKPKEAGE
jgi:hypothetical protein